MSLTCDITGINPLFKIYGLRYRINTPSEAYKLVLPQVGYKESVVVKKINANGGLDVLINGTDFIFTSGNRDTASEALVKGAYPTFANQLYNSFYIPVATFGDAAYIDIIVDFQSVFPNILTSAVDQSGNPDGPTCTPELLKQIVEDLILLKGSSAGEDINYSTAQSLPSPLATDYTGVLADNFISDEAHNILANDGKVVIRPANGSFYDHGLVVRVGNTVLTRETDYTVRGMDVAATKVCEHPSGVWRFIIITKNITGMVHISYHAFGGEVNVQNFLNIRDQVQNLKDYIDKGSFLTANSIGGTPLMQEVVERLNTHDRYYRSLNMSGYRDMSNRFVALPNGSSDQSNWYRVAYLYKQSNSNDDNNYFKTYTKDSVRLKLRLENSGIILDMFVYANVVNRTLKLSIMESDSDTGFANPDNYSNLKSVVLPQFRLVWKKDENDGYDYGAVLQIKFPIPVGFENEIVSIENHNKAGLGGWILRGDANGTDEVVAENDTVLLPDGQHVWLSSGPSNEYESIEAYPDFKRGILIWAGSVPFIKKDGDDGKPLKPCIESSINCKDIKNISFVLFDRVFGRYITKTVSSNSVDEKSCMVSAVFDDLDLSGLIFKLYHDVNNNPSIVIYMRPGTKSNLLHRFDLRQIHINSTEV